MIVEMPNVNISAAEKDMFQNLFESIFRDDIEVNEENSYIRLNYIELRDKPISKFIDTWYNQPVKSEMTLDILTVDIQPENIEVDEDGWVSNLDILSVTRYHVAPTKPTGIEEFIKEMEDKKEPRMIIIPVVLGYNTSGNMIVTQNHRDRMSKRYVSSKPLPARIKTLTPLVVGRGDPLKCLNIRPDFGEQFFENTNKEESNDE
jgi:hypothetical protein